MLYYATELSHHGVKGMKWGVRKEYKPVGRKSSSVLNKRSISINDIKKSVISKDKELENDHKNHDRIIKKAERTGKSAAEIEQEESPHKGLSDNQKKAIAIGAAVTVAALATYGAYKYTSIRRNDSSRTESLMLKTFTHSDSGKTDFIRNAFSDCGEYSAFSNTPQNKIAVNNLLTESSGTWWNRLSHAEKNGITTYSGNAYTKMNNALWAAKGDDIYKYTDSKTAAQIMSANNALRKASFPTSMVCTQGLSVKNACSFLGCSEDELYKAALNKGRGSKLIGAVNTNHGLFSTSTTSNSGFSGGVKYKVLTPKGAHAAYIEHISKYGDLPHPPMWNGKKSGGPPFSKEFETLFAAGSKFKTKGIQYNESGGFIEVALEYIF